MIIITYNDILIKNCTCGRRPYIDNYMDFIDMYCPSKYSRPFDKHEYNIFDKISCDKSFNSCILKVIVEWNKCNVNI